MMEHIISKYMLTKKNTYVVEGASYNEEDYYIWALEFDLNLEPLVFETKGIHREIANYVLSQRIRVIVSEKRHEDDSFITHNYIRKLNREEIISITTVIYPDEIIIKIFSEEPPPDVLEHLVRIPGTNLKARFDKQDTSTKTMKHVHILKKGKELFSVNFDGSAHLRINKGKEIPKSVANYLREYKHYQINSNNVLTMVNIDINKIYVNEILEFVKNGEEYTIKYTC